MTSLVNEEETKDLLSTTMKDEKQSLADCPGQAEDEVSNDKVSIPLIETLILRNKHAFLILCTMQISNTSVPQYHCFYKEEKEKQESDQENPRNVEVNKSQN